LVLVLELLLLEDELLEVKHSQDELEEGLREDEQEEDLLLQLQWVEEDLLEEEQELCCCEVWSEGGPCSEREWGGDLCSGRSLGLRTDRSLVGALAWAEPGLVFGLKRCLLVEGLLWGRWDQVQEEDLQTTCSLSTEALASWEQLVSGEHPLLLVSGLLLFLLRAS
jgi:hypothetical protein